MARQRGLTLHGFSDGSGGSPRGSSAGSVLLNPKTGEMLKESSRVIPICSNNVAEYEGVILLLETAFDYSEETDTEIEKLVIHSDSQLIVNQVMERWKVKDPALGKLRETVWSLARGLDSIEIKWVPRERNVHADSLCRKALDAASPKRTKKNKKAERKKRIRKLREPEIR